MYGLAEKKGDPDQHSQRPTYGLNRTWRSTLNSQFQFGRVLFALAGRRLTGNVRPRKMNPRHQGFGKLLILVPVISYIPLSILMGDLVQTRRTIVLSASLAVSGLITLVIAAIQDKKAGLDIFSRHAWTDGIMESQHIFFYLPIRLVGVIMLVASGAVFFI